MNGYFVITTTKDGDVSIEFYDSKEAIEQLLNEEIKDYCHSNGWLAKIENSDQQACQGRYLIKGSFITPRVVELVTRYSVE